MNRTRWVLPLLTSLLVLASHMVDGSEGTKGSSPGAGTPAKQQPLFAVRELYAPGHFGNSYEVMGENEMRGVLAEAAHWGFNRYGDWFDVQDCSDPFAEKKWVQLAHALWQRKKANFHSAKAAGLECDLLVTPNHVYIDQCLPHLLAVKKGRIFGQLICPSKPEARAIILRNHENLLADLARAGVRLKSLSACPYDFGGCACEACQPWIVTFARLVQEIFAVAERHHPGIELHMVGWWWTDEEHKLFAEWAQGAAPGRVKSIFLHIPYGAADVGNPPLPGGCTRGAFVHIGYADQSQPRDQYGLLGPVVAPARLQETVRRLATHEATGVMAYSEGVLDDVNKALLAGLASGKFRTADDVLAAYARRYFHADEKAAAQWAQWLKRWGEPFAVDTRQAAQKLSQLIERTPATSWRRRQWELKLELFRAHAAVGQGPEWTPARLAAVDRFWAVQEQLYREVWGLGPLRHIFDRRYTALPWHAAWSKHVSQSSPPKEK